MSAPAAADANEPTLLKTLAPLPSTRRGYGIVLNQSPKDGRMVYTNGRCVVIRSIQDPSDSLIFSEHKAAVSAAVFAPNGNWVASGDVEGNVLIWSYPQLKLKTQFQVAKSISDLDWDADGTRIVAGGDGAQKARVFSWDSGNNLGEVTMHSHPVITCSYRKVRPFRVATGGEDLAVNFYEGPPFKYKRSFKGHARYPNCVRFSPDGSKFASVGADSKIVLFDGATGEVIRESEDKVADGHKGAIYAFAWSPDSSSLLTASADKTAKVWNMDLQVTQTFTFGADTMDQQVGALWVGEQMLTVSLSGAINLLDSANPSQPRLVLHGHQSTVQSLALDRAGGFFYTAGLTGEITRWDMRTGLGRWMSGKGHGGKVVSALCLSNDASKLLSFGLDDKVRVSDANSGVLSDDAGDLGGLPVAAAASPTEADVSVAALAQEKLVLLRGVSVQSTVNLGFTPTAVAFGNDGKVVFVAGKDKPIRVFDLSSGSTLTERAASLIKTHDKPVSSVRMSPSGSMLASVDAEASVYVHALNGSNFDVQNRSGWRFHQAGVRDVDWNAASTRLATASQDNHIILWRDLATWQGSERTRIKDAHVDGVAFVRFWSDGQLISVGGERAIKIWNLPASA